MTTLRTQDFSLRDSSEPEPDAVHILNAVMEVLRYMAYTREWISSACLQGMQTKETQSHMTRGDKERGQSIDKEIQIKNNHTGQWGRSSERGEQEAQGGMAANRWSRLHRHTRRAPHSNVSVRRGSPQPQQGAEGDRGGWGAGTSRTRPDSPAERTPECNIDRRHPPTHAPHAAGAEIMCMCDSHCHLLLLLLAHAAAGAGPRHNKGEGTRVTRECFGAVIHTYATLHQNGTFGCD